MSLTLAPTRRRTAAAALTAALLVPLAACSSGDDTTKDTAGSTGSGSAGATPKANLTVLAAASLTDVFKTAGAAYEKSHPGTKITFSFAGSQELVAQISQGSPADVLVTADTKSMDKVKADTGTPAIIAKNRLVIATGEGNPFKVDDLKDLADTKVKVVLAAPEVPAGKYSKQILDKQGITVKPVSQEPNVRAVLSKVELGEADAGLVYRTDAESAKDKVDAVEIPDDQNAIAKYPAATIKDSKNAEAAAAFVAWLSSPEGQKILQDAGFQKP
ncbi:MULTISPECIES: molybdate ABC transporter substrate-binding protein [Streptomyces]|uniref:Molybdenum ABC transporter, periplasmic molybdenum-binding protein ModA n=1 Tax=Streptomyces venezuelae (strain ATCC 10712 / CBS 650.69 / DSM 40230 / JCM 4526 / NBRC 13096 / PD 04745) TaxID=953739 RepID=F2RC82_STRVP|nr:molybdate ABC transporter substrate-binding protein [Streptomyces venezuelae]APE24826.1 molybdate ABC transporter substrate-binding protein [Streptomyces venezuelae]QES02171.1 molybdate ABC transporter substrate-binding protein [Streptomyces venezuelae ATCC 10712]CCA59333.1 Molybdenum ABC transporter, periplasmic molybdenum-binding protein ModA [Streptomyces venezuelae ATCC 10712]